MLLTFVSLCIDAGVIPPGSSPYPYFVSVQNGFTSALITCLLINGFVGFQLYEDGTPLSLWMLRLLSAIGFVISFLVSLATFKSWAGLGPTNTIGLFVVLYLLNAVQLFIYLTLQILLVVRTLEDRWPLGDISFGLFFFVAGQVILYAFSAPLCSAISHYLDGLFFATTCNLLAVMMVYKYWDSITKEDLEFSVSTRMNNWEVKELLPEEDRRTTVYHDDPYGHSSAYDHPYSPTANRYSAVGH
jgi:Chitin synthase export chaperone